MIDHSFINELNEGYEEGGLFIGGESQKIQQSFLQVVLKGLNPKKILEIGTHTANFCYFAKTMLPEAKIMTFGIKPHSAEAVAKVNNRMGREDITFVLGNSVETVPQQVWNADVAWVDGGHDHATAFSDLKNCAEKNIPFLLLDDTRMPDVQLAMVDFLRNFRNYKIIWSSPDVRGIVLLSSQAISEDDLMKYFVDPFLRLSSR